VKPEWLANGKLLVPVRVTGNGIVGDTMVEIDAGHPDYAQWLAYLERWQAAQRMNDES
jgi:hypothetical protein